jgi:hypothetical protein
MAADSRSFTIRVPLETYFELSRLAANDDENLNTKVNHIIRLGLGKHVSLTQALHKLLRNAVVDEASGND